MYDTSTVSQEDQDIRKTPLHLSVATRRDSPHWGSGRCVVQMVSLRKIEVNPPYGMASVTGIQSP